MTTKSQHLREQAAMMRRHGRDREAAKLERHAQELEKDAADRAARKAGKFLRHAQNSDVVPFWKGAAKEADRRRDS